MHYFLHTISSTYRSDLCGPVQPGTVEDFTIKSGLISFAGDQKSFYSLVKFLKKKITLLKLQQAKIISNILLVKESLLINNHRPKQYRKFTCYNLKEIYKQEEQILTFTMPNYETLKLLFNLFEIQNSVSFKL